MNLNTAAKWVTKHEGGKQSLSIAQVKEVIRLFLVYCCKHATLEGVVDAIVRVGGRKRK